MIASLVRVLQQLVRYLGLFGHGATYSTESNSDTSTEDSLERQRRFLREGRNRWPSARVSTIYPDDQGADRAPPLEVERQRSFTGPYVISSSLADQKCRTFGVQGLLNELNGIMGTLYTLSASLESLLTQCISLDYDFGLAYSYLRPEWQHRRGPDFDTLAVRRDKVESSDAAQRRDALDSSKRLITNPHLKPRRVWDLYSNRVIPYHWWGGYYTGYLPVSHSWVAEHERSGIWTSINGCEWPVPIPDDSSLERVRIELLNYAMPDASVTLGRGYSWLDVLCLRQVGVERDDVKRLEEWKTDVPTIGSIYGLPNFHPALVYFNGLGRPFCNGSYDDPRHWFNRAWTVQEAVMGPLLGGATPSSPTIKRQLQLQPSPELKEFYARFTSAFAVGSYQVFIFSSYIVTMRKRHATTELDRISGLASISTPNYLPIYDLKQSNEDAWEMLMKISRPRSRAHLFFWYPVAGPTRYLWFPSWSQVMMPDVPAADGRIEGRSEISYDDMQGEFCGVGLRIIENCLVLGLDFPSLEISSGSSIFRTGSIILGTKHTQRGPRSIQ